MQYTIEQFLAAAEQAEVSMIDAQHICDTLVKMNQHEDEEYCDCEHPTLGTNLTRCGTCSKWFKRVTP